MNVIKGLMLLLCLDWILICIEEHERGKKIVCQQKEELIHKDLAYTDLFIVQNCTRVDRIL